MEKGFALSNRAGVQCRFSLGQIDQMEMNNRDAEESNRRGMGLNWGGERVSFSKIGFPFLLFPFSLCCFDFCRFFCHRPHFVLKRSVNGVIFPVQDLNHPF